MRLIDADALENDLRSQFESVYKHIRDTVNPSDFYIERKAAYDKKLMEMGMEAFCQYLQSRPTLITETYEQENANLKQMLRNAQKHIKGIERERDAAISEIGRDCETCKHYAACHSPVFCDECGYWGGDRYVCCTCEDLDKWEWRGVCEENSPANPGK